MDREARVLLVCIRVVPAGLHDCVVVQVDAFDAAVEADAAHVAAEVGKLSFARVPCCICWGELSLVPRLAIACIRARHQVEREGVRRGRVVVLEKVNVLCVLGDPVRGSVHHPRRCRPKSNRVARYATVTATATRSADPHIVRAAVIERMQHS